MAFTANSPVILIRDAAWDSEHCSRIVFNTQTMFRWSFGSTPADRSQVARDFAQARLGRDAMSRLLFVFASLGGLVQKPPEDEIDDYV